MTLLAETVALLEANGSPHAMIGATALAVLGASRSTQDLDLLTVDRSVLREPYWSELEARGAAVEVRTGDISDPLAGVVRITRAGDRPVDVIVGEAPWQERAIAEASPYEVAGARVRVVDGVGFALLKLYAGGPQDLWDVEQLLAIAPDRDTLVARIEERVTDLPARSRRLWPRVASREPS